MVYSVAIKSAMNFWHAKIFITVLWINKNCRS